ncbi:PqqD family protein [Candidatus Methylobacter oryzae]|uniref:PqqD family protein n=2 Tax=Candidatus Methylobacter oryzae TaxID=2497749 RepID=A0ABY3C7K1_9GAMM|nr:PqqD family protein [Candidatus Methylobacter oryzae]
MSDFDPANRYIRNPDLVSADMDGDTVAMSIERGEYFGIGGVGSRAWALLEQPVFLEDAVRTICTEFEVDEATCRADLIAFFNDLLAHELIAAVAD